MRLIPIIILALILLSTGSSQAVFPPLPVDILNPSEKLVGRARIYSNYVEIFDAAQRRKGAIGVMLVDGLTQLFLVQSDGEKALIGWAENHRLFDKDGKLVGFYQWTPIWSYVYDKSQKKMGKAQCLAYQGICAAGVAGYLLGLY